MKNLLLLLTISSASLFAMDKGARVKARDKAMSAGQPRAAISRTKERTSFDSLFEPVPAPSKSPCEKTCICMVCLERAHAELEKDRMQIGCLEKRCRIITVLMRLLLRVWWPNCLKLQKNMKILPDPGQFTTKWYHDSLCSFRNKSG